MLFVVRVRQLPFKKAARSGCCIRLCIDALESLDKEQTVFMHRWKDVCCGVHFCTRWTAAAIQGFTEGMLATMQSK
jgi:hypothetical protein